MENEGDPRIISMEYFWFICTVQFNIYVFADPVGESHERSNRYDLKNKFESVSSTKEDVEDVEDILLVTFVGTDW